MATARRSAQGCQSCRQARVRCDGQRPVCARCVRLHLPCSGYRDPSELVFVDEGATAAQRRSQHRPSASVSARPGRSLHAPSTVGSLYIAPCRSLPNGKAPWLRQIPPSRHQWSLQHSAIAYFFSRYVIFPSSSAVHDGYLGDLPYLYARSDPASALHHAVLTCSLASFARASGNADLIMAAQLQFTTALASLREACQDATLVKQDETLMALLVLDFYWLLDDDNPGAIGPHTEGIEPVLRLRGVEQLYSSVGWNLFCVAHRRLYRRLILKQPALHESTEWLNMLDPALPVVHGSQRILRIMKACDAAREAIRLIEVEHQTNHVVSVLQAAMAELESLDGTMETWKRTVPQLWRTNLSEPLDPTTTESVPSYTYDIFVANYWNYQRNFHVLLHETLASCWSYSVSQSDGGDQAEYIRRLNGSYQAAQQAIQDTLATVPFLLGQLDCYGNSAEHAAGTDRASSLNVPQDLGVYFTHIALKPVLESTIATVAQKYQAENMLQMALHQLKARRI